MPAFRLFALSLRRFRSTSLDLQHTSDDCSTSGNLGRRNVDVRRAQVSPASAYPGGLRKAYSAEMTLQDLIGLRYRSLNICTVWRIRNGCGVVDIRNLAGLTGQTYTLSVVAMILWTPDLPVGHAYLLYIMNSHPPLRPLPSFQLSLPTSCSRLVLAQPLFPLEFDS